MKKLLDYADMFAKQSSWKDFALVKFCLCAIGVIIGVLLPKTVMLPVLIIAVTVFILTYIPLMIKFFKVVSRGEDNK